MLHPFPKNIPDTFLEDLENLLDRQRKTINQLAENAPATYEGLLKPMQDLDEELELFFTPLSHLNSVLNSETTQRLYQAALPLLSAFESEVTQHEPLFKKIEQLTPSADGAGAVTRHTQRDFILAGATLDPKKKERMKQIDQELSELGNQFSQNLLDATNRYDMILTDPADVAGLPPSDLEAAKHEHEGETVWRFTLQMPSYIAYMTYGSNRARREELYRAYNTRAPQNGEVIDALLRLRAEKAQLLGYPNYAEYALQKRDAPSGEAVLNFLNELADAALPQARQELETLRQFAQEVDGLEDLAPWDVAYYSEKLKQQTLDLDDALIRPYLEQSRVLGGLLKMISKLFSVDFIPTEVPVWHERVHAYDLIEGDEPIGRIFFDLEARPEKRGGAWMHNWETHYIDAQGTQHLPSAFVVANFSPASATQPSLLRHDDVVTLFHEMGHALHHLLSRCTERSVSGIHGVDWDAVEFPSQFLENFAYEAPVLRRFAFHHESGDPLPKEWIARIKEGKNFQAALGILRQVEFSLFDFQLHQDLYQGDEVQALLDRIREKTALLPPPKSNRFQHGFSHIFSGGYAAGYYSYKWAEVLSADAFFQCLNAEGDFDPIQAQRYRDHILARGGSAPMSQLFYAWLGRTPQTKTLLSLYGIAPVHAS